MRTKNEVVKILLASGSLLIFISPLCYGELPGKAEYRDSFQKRGEDSVVVKPRILEVGPGKDFPSPGAAAKHARDGDTIIIDSSTEYLNDWAVWHQNDLVIKGKKQYAKIVSTKNIGNGKAIWITKGNNIRIENIEFSGAKVSDKNGAGIRAEGTDLFVKNCYFHHNQNGILAGKNLQSTITIINSEFSHNGHGQGKTHNVYVGDIKKLRFVGNFSHHANVGHLLKSRAARSEILYNRLMDGNDGNASYQIDLPNGGFTIIMGNVIQQGPESQNSTLLAYGMRKLSPKNENKLYVTFNTFVNLRHASVFIRTKKGAEGIIANNVFSGKGEFKLRTLEKGYNLVEKSLSIFADVDTFDFNLNKNVDIAAGIKVLKTSEGEQLIPEYQPAYKGIIKRKSNTGEFDPGAYQRK